MSKATGFLDTQKTEPMPDVARCMVIAKKEYGKSLFSQISEMAMLAFSPRKIQPAEYYYFRLYDDDRFSFADKRAFVGRNAQNKIFFQCNALDWLAVAHDKLMFAAALEGLALPTPEIYAIYHGFRTFGTAPALRGRDALTDFLRTGMHYPFFSKPVTGMYSVGAAAVREYDAARDSLVLANGKAIPVQQCADEIAPFDKDGYLFQELLMPHPVIEEVCGDRISTARIIVALTDRGPEILHALWKIPAGDNVADNFWRPGNMLAAVAIESGRVHRVVQGTGPDQVEVQVHPDSSKPVQGLILPDWKRLTDLCLTGAAAFPKLRLQAWDVAMCASGPVLLEMNIGGDFNLPQVANGCGLLDERFRGFLAACNGG